MYVWVGWNGWGLCGTLGIRTSTRVLELKPKLSSRVLGTRVSLCSYGKTGPLLPYPGLGKRALNPWAALVNRVRKAPTTGITANVDLWSHSLPRTGITYNLRPLSSSAAYTLYIANSWCGLYFFSQPGLIRCKSWRPRAHSQSYLNYGIQL